ncbi:MAG TPA: M23 family metallopeptidase [Mucilaginibacter sp.]|jgi:murein DD-endopeptidase MepM/ murein hydrolase activator NlpD|nr:M23 family metallopeptidase [Mucilaginibacter sp.]
MKLNSKDISTLIIVNKNKQGTKTVQIETRHINHLKYYALGLVGVLALLVGSIIFLHRQNQQQELEKQQLLTQIVSLKGQIPVELQKQVEKNSAQSYIQAIEGKLKRINDYLRKRGLKGFSTKSVGGDNNVEGNKLTDKEVYMAYDDYLTHLVNTVAFTPMGYPRISSMTSSFGFRNDPFDSGHAEFHPGIDFKGNKGDVAKCTANGRVVAAGWNGGYGNCVRVAHANGFETLYGHLSRITVKVGQQLAVGDKVGEVGSTGHSTGTHLHYEVRKNGKPVNPVKFLTLNN